MPTEAAILEVPDLGAADRTQSLVKHERLLGTQLLDLLGQEQRPSLLADGLALTAAAALFEAQPDGSGNRARPYGRETRARPRSPAQSEKSFGANTMRAARLFSMTSALCMP